MPDADPKDTSQQDQRRSWQGEIEALCRDHASALSAGVAGVASAELARVTEALTAEIQERDETIRATKAQASEEKERLEQAAAETKARLEEILAETKGHLEGLARAIRKIRGTSDAVEVLSELVDVTPRFCARSALLLRSGGRLIGFRAAGNGTCPDAEGMQKLSLGLVGAPAIAHAVESRDTVVTKGSQQNLSRRLSQGLGYGDEDEVSVHPVVLRDTVLGVLLINEPVVAPAAIEALVQASEAWIEALGSRPESGEDQDE